MTVTLAQRLQAERARRFVGREQEIATFRAMLRDDTRHILLYAYGPGGIGKSTWAAHCAQLAAELDVGVLRLDARAIPAEPAQILAALGMTGDRAPWTPSREGSAPPDLLLIDTFEYWQALESWVRETLLPQLPAHVRILICSRRPPSLDWKLDPGWVDLMAVCRIGEFSGDEAIRYLSRRAVPMHRVDDAIDFSHRNPLALAITADLLEREPQAELRHRIDLESTRQLVERITREGSTPEQRAALQLAAVAMETDTSLLATTLPGVDAVALCEWLSGLSFMSSGLTGLYPHDLVREILLAEMLGRHPGRYEELARRVFDRDIQLLLASAASDWRLVAALVQRAVFAIRAAHGLEGFMVINAGGEMYADLAQPSDLPVIEAAIERHQGARARDWFRHWQQAQPKGLVVLRSPNQAVLGFLLYVELSSTSPEQRAMDPVIEALWNEVTRSTLDRGAVACCRFWMSLAEHQRSSRVSTVLSTLCLGFAATYPGLSVMSIVHSEEAEYWVRFGQRVHIDAPPELCLELDGHRFQTMVSDWRRESRLEWLRQFSLRVTEVAATRSDAPALTLNTAEGFAAAVHDALQHFHETSRLQNSPLLEARMLRAKLAPQDGPAKRLGALRELIRETVAALGEVQTTARAARILHQTYLEPARSQQLAAEALGLGYSTYRRLLAQARKLIAAELWQLEQ